MRKKECSKRQLTHKQAMGFLHKLKDGGYDKRPWRDEVSFYKCDSCNTYHISSKTDPEGKTVLQGNYLDFQKEKWRNFLQKYSANKAVISNNLKRAY